MINENKIFDVVIYGNGLSAKSALVALTKQEYKILWINNINKEEYDDRKQKCQYCSKFYMDLEKHIKKNHQ